MTPQNEFTQLISTEVNVLHKHDPLNFFDLRRVYAPLNLQQRHSIDPTIRQVQRWLDGHPEENQTYASHGLRKYAKHKNRLTPNDGVLYRQYLKDLAQVAHLTFCVPKHLRHEILYRIHISQLSGHLGINKTVTEFQKQFSPVRTEYLLKYVRIC